MAIKNGDRLIMTTEKGDELAVVAAGGESGGKVVVDQFGAKVLCPVKNLRASDAEEEFTAEHMPVSKDRLDLSGARPLCPKCSEPGECVLPARTDTGRGVLVVDCRCPEGHSWKRERWLK